jgi:hypothetical protein
MGVSNLPNMPGDSQDVKFHIKDYDNVVSFSIATDNYRRRSMRGPLPSAAASGTSPLNGINKDIFGIGGLYSAKIRRGSAGKGVCNPVFPRL